MPNREAYVMPGIMWGSFDELMTPAYWRGQTWQHEQLGNYKNFRLGRSLREEVAACLLGGFGMKADLGLLAFDRLREAGLLTETPLAPDIESLLEKPFEIEGKKKHYRFPRQKAHYLAGCLDALNNLNESNDDIQFRNQLMELPGIGPKTASWIVRNYKGSNAVAIIDVHILRIGKHIGFFSKNMDPQKDYIALENAFINFAQAIKVSAGLLDAIMWDYMRRLQFLVKENRQYTLPALTT